MPDQFFINIALLAVGVSIGALLGETSRQQHDRALFRSISTSWPNQSRKTNCFFRECSFKTQKGASHEEEQE